MKFFEKVSVVIPVYNENKNIIFLLDELLPIIAKNSGGEVIVVDDCSTDESAKLTSDYTQYKDIPVILLRHAKRFGQSACLLTGIKHSNYETIITLDGDGQNNPSDINNLLKVWNEKQDIRELLLLIGNRVNRKDTFSKKIASRFALHIRRIFLKDNTPDTGCGIKIFSKKMFLSLPYFDHIHRFLPALVKRQGGQIMSIPVLHRARVAGQSKYSNWHRLRVGILDLWGVFWLIRRSPFPIRILDEDIINQDKEKD